MRVGELKLEGFTSWLHGLPQDEFFCHGNNCPLMEYAQSLGIKEPLTFVRSRTYYPYWSIVLARLIDDMASNWLSITPQEVLVIIDHFRKGYCNESKRVNIGWLHSVPTRSA